MCKLLCYQQCLPQQQVAGQHAGGVRRVCERHALCVAIKCSRVSVTDGRSSEQLRAQVEHHRVAVGMNSECTPLHKDQDRQEIA